MKKTTYVIIGAIVFVFLVGIATAAYAALHVEYYPM